MTNHLLNKPLGGAVISRRRAAGISFQIIALVTIFACASLPEISSFTSSASAAGSSRALEGSLNLTSTVISGGDQLTGVITLSNPTLANITLNLSAIPDSIVKMPASVTFRGGERAVSFPIATLAVQSTQKVTITARPSGLVPPTEITARLSVVPGIVKSLWLNRTSAVGGTTGSIVTGTVTLEFKAPPDGARVDIQSTVTPGFGPAVFMPPNVEVPGNATGAQFPITTVPVIAPRVATISATLGGTTRTANLTIEPLCVTGLFIFVPPLGQGPFQAQGTLALNAPARPNTVVTLFSGNPASVRFGTFGNETQTESLPFNEGELGPKLFNVTAGSVGQQTVVTITARVNASECTATRQIMVRP